MTPERVYFVKKLLSLSSPFPKMKDEDLLLAHEKVLEVVWSVESSYITQPTQQGATKPHRPHHMEQ